MAGYDSGPGYAVRARRRRPDRRLRHLEVPASRARISIPTATSTIRSSARKPIPSRTSPAARSCSGSRTTRCRADLRVYMSQVDTQALYFNITESVNDTSLPVRVNNRGVNERDMCGASLKLDFDLGGGTLTSITAYDKLEEILTGDQFDFLPIPESVLFNGSSAADQAQHQWLDVEAREPGDPLHLARRPALALDSRRLRHRDRPLHLDRQRVRLRHRRRARGQDDTPAAASSTRSSAISPIRRTTWPGRCSAS